MSLLSSIDNLLSSILGDNSNKAPSEDRVTVINGSSDINRSSLVWTPDEFVAYCWDCTTEFTFLTRKHHCRSCGQIFCEECSRTKVPPNNAEFEQPRRVCFRCYVKKIEQAYLPKKIIEFMETLPISSTKIEALKKHPPIEVTKNIKGENLYIASDLKGWPALTIPGFKFEVSFRGCRIETSKNVVPFPIFEPSKQLSTSSKFEAFQRSESQNSLQNTNINEAWIEHRRQIMNHGRAVVIDCSNNFITISNCVIEGRVAVSVLGGQNILFQNCLLKGESALEIRGSSFVRLDHCILIASNDHEYPEDEICCPWGIADTPKQRQDLKQQMSPKFGDCKFAGKAIFATDESRCQLISCYILGMIGLCATQKAHLRLKGCIIRSSRAAIDLWGESVVNVEEVSHIGHVRKHSPLAKYRVERTNLNSSIPRDFPKTGTCFRCRMDISLLAQHHCRICKNSVCGRCSSERAFIYSLESSEVTRVCFQCCRDLIPRHWETPTNYSEAEVKSENTAITFFPALEKSTEVKTKKNNIVLSGTTRDIKEKYFFFTLPHEFLKSEDDNFNAYFIAELDENTLEAFLLLATSKEVKIPNQESRLETYKKNDAFLAPEEISIVNRGSDNVKGYIYKKVLPFKESIAYEYYSWVLEILLEDKFFLQFTLQSNLGAAKRGAPQIFDAIFKSFQIAVPIELFKQMPKETIAQVETVVKPKVGSLSGQLSVYSDTMHRWRLSVPIECKLEKGSDKSTVLWTIVDLLLIFVEVTIDEDAAINKMCLDIREKETKKYKGNKKREILQLKKKKGTDIGGFLIKDIYETPNHMTIVDPNEGKKINWLLCMPSVHKLYQVHISVAYQRFIEWELILEMVVRSFKIDFNA